VDQNPARTDCYKQGFSSSPPPIQRVPGAVSGGKAAGTWSYTSTPPVRLMAWCLVKHRDNFIFYHYKDACLLYSYLPVAVLMTAHYLGSLVVGYCVKHENSYRLTERLLPQVMGISCWLLEVYLTFEDPVGPVHGRHERAGICWLRHDKQTRTRAPCHVLLIDKLSFIDRTSVTCYGEELERLHTVQPHGFPFLVNTSTAVRVEQRRA